MTPDVVERSEVQPSLLDTWSPLASSNSSKTAQNLKQMAAQVTMAVFDMY